MSMELQAAVAQLEDTDVPYAALTVVAYIDRDGDQGWTLRTAGDNPISTFIGLMEMAKHSLCHEAEEEMDV